MGGVAVKKLAGSIGLLTVLLTGILALAPAGASAEPLCTDTWTGPVAGEWEIAADWSTGKVPTSTEVACIGSGDTVYVIAGANHAGVLEDQGALAILGGSLELANALEASSVASLTLRNGSLTAASTLDVSSSLRWESGTMSGSGTTVLESGASGVLEKSTLLEKRNFTNEGTIEFSPGNGTFQMSDGAVLQNNGTFTDAESGTGGIEVASGSTSAPLIVNSGTFEKTGSSANTTVAVKFENKGTVKTREGIGGYFAFTDGGSGASGTWAAADFAGGSFSLVGDTFSGANQVGGGTVTATEGLHGTTGEVDVSSGSLTLSGGTTTFAGLTLKSTGLLTGAGTLDVSSSLNWDAGGTMSGSGSTVLGPSLSGTLEKSTLLEKRTLNNEGTLVFSPGNGAFLMSDGAVLENKGTFNDYETGSGAIEVASGSISAPSIVNSGTFEKTVSNAETTIAVKFENKGTVKTKEGIGGYFVFTDGGSGASGTWAAADFAGGSFSLVGDTFNGAINVTGGTVTATEGLHGTTGQVDVSSGSLTLSGGTTTFAGLTLTGAGLLTGAGTLDVSTGLAWDAGGKMSGSGATVLKSGASATLEKSTLLEKRKLTNEGTIEFNPGNGAFLMSDGAVLQNKGTFNDVVTGSGAIEVASGSTSSPLFVNSGTLEKTVSGANALIAVAFENEGVIAIRTGGKFEFTDPVIAESSTQWGGAEDPSTLGHLHCTSSEDPVSCATGNYFSAETDFAIGGRGVGLDLTRTYNAQAAAAGEHGIFGYGWTSSFSDHLVVNKTSKVTTLHQAEGSTVPFTEGTGGSFTAPAWTQDILSGTEAGGYTLTLANQIKYKFAGSSGRLESVTDRDGNAITLTYNGGGQLMTITDPVSRTIKLTYNGEGLVESAEDPMKHVVKYTYEGGNLKSVTQPAEAALRWQFKYNGEHEITEVTDGRGGKTINEYNASQQVVSQKDTAERTLTFEYEPFQTKITNKNTGSVTFEQFTSGDEPSAITRGYGTESATTESFTYNTAGLPLTITDGNGHTTKYGYDSANDRTSMVDANKNETKWTYDSTHDVETMTTPKGEKTTIKREAHGNPETISRPAPESMTQTTKYTYGTHGELESVEDPLKRVWKYGYDSKGDRTSETDPETNKRTWEYNEDSQETATIGPRGNVVGGKPAEFTTKIERDAQGRPLKITDPLGHTTKYTYDGDGNVETLIDGNSHTTKYTYNADNEPTKVEEPNKATTETEYDGAGQVTSQTDGNKHITKYVRNVLEQVTEVEDPLKHKTLKEYDLAGNLKKLTDPAKRTTTYTYDPGNRLTEVVYSSGKPSTIKDEYDKDGDRTKMTDGTGTSKYTYDVLDRLTEAETGHKEKTKYEYDLANEQTKITYPSTKAVTRAFDKDGRLEKVTDWSANVTKFTYDPDSDLATTLFPAESKDEDTYAYNDADQMSEVKMLKGAETLASLVYTRDNDGQVKGATSKGLPGEEKPAYEYDENNRLTKGSTVAYEYDAANNPTKIGTGAYKYNAADQLESGPSLTYTYDELGERTKTKPTTGPATTYGYDQAGDLTSVERPKEGETAEIKDTYAYNGEGLRASQTINGTTTYLTWDMTEGLPLMLSDTTNSYIYGPGGLPIEQISSGGTVTYLHHDQQGSTRVLTGSTGTVTGKCTYGAYGTPTCEGASTTPLGYDGQYASSDTGLIYMRARVYDPATAQFLTVDPLVGMTGAPYNYAGDNAVNEIDPTGLGWFGEEVLEELGTRYVGFVDGLTSPLGGGTAALRSDLGLNGGLNTCSVEYQVADAIGGYTRDAEGAVAGAYALAGAVADAGGASSLLSRLADETGSFDPVAEPGSDPAVSEVLQGKLGSITKAPLPPGSPSWADIADMPLSEIRAAAQSNEPGFKTILKLLTSGRFNKP